MIVINVGDVVSLKTNFSPKMTVEKCDPYHAECVWFDDQGNLHRDTFPILSLIKENRPGLGENILLG